MNKEPITELYWLCEELLSYTDLTGERFDKENAQRRLFPMRPWLELLADEALWDYYQKLDEQLDSFAFDKMEFSQILNDFFDVLQSKHKAIQL